MSVDEDRWRVLPSFKLFTVHHGVPASRQDLYIIHAKRTKLRCNPFGTTLDIYIVFRAGRDGWNGQEFDQLIHKPLIILVGIFKGILSRVSHGVSNCCV